MGDPDWFADNYEFQVPIFVLTHHPPQKMPRQTERLTITFVGEGIQRAIAKAKEAAGTKNVMVIGGASTFQQCLNAGLADEVRIGIMPVLLGDGLKLFEHVDSERVKLEKVQVIDSTPSRTDIAYRVVK